MVIFIRWLQNCNQYGNFEVNAFMIDESLAIFTFSTIFSTGYGTCVKVS